MKVKFKRFSSQAKISQKATIGSAFYDLFVAKSVVLDPNVSRLVETDLDFWFPEKCMTKIFPRFSLSLWSIHVGGGIVNAEYIGKIRVITNLPNNRVEFTAGDRFAQLLFQKKKDVIF